jgi:hypothetical protein
MKKAALVFCSLVICAFLAGCGQATPEEQFLSHWEKVVALHSENKADPAKAQDAVKAYLDAHLAEMKSLSGQFGNKTDKKIAEDPRFIERVLKLMNSITDLEKTNKSLLDNPGVAQAVKPLIDLIK